VRQEIARVLADPEIVIRQAAASQPTDEGRVDLNDEAERQLSNVIEQQKRLARLFVSGDLPEEVLNHESARLAEERNRLEGLLRLGREVRPLAPAPSLTDVFDAVRILREWLEAAEDKDFRMFLQALDVTVAAAPDQAVISGVIPAGRPLADSRSENEILTIVQTSASPFTCTKNGLGWPFRLTVELPGRRRR
jgi:hypothetical protein